MSASQELPAGDWFWTASGQAVGHREQNLLFAEDGRQIGEFWDDDVYGPTGFYLGEISSNGRLIINTRKLKWKRAGFQARETGRLQSPEGAAQSKLASGFANFKIPQAARESGSIPVVRAVECLACEE